MPAKSVVQAWESSTWTKMVLADIVQVNLPLYFDHSLCHFKIMHCKSYKSNASPRGIELTMYADITDITLKHWEVMWLIRLHLLYQNMLPKPSKIDFPICLWVQTLWTPTHMYLQCRIKKVTAGFIKCVLSEFDWVDAGLTIGLPTILDCSFFSFGCLVVLTQALNDFTQFAVAISGSGWPLPYQWSLSTPQRRYLMGRMSRQRVRRV